MIHCYNVNKIRDEDEAACISHPGHISNRGREAKKVAHAKMSSVPLRVIHK